MNRSRMRTGAVIGIVVLGALGGGCDLLLDGDSDSILGLLAEYGITEDTTVADALDQLTVGDVVTAFVDHADEAMQNVETGRAPGLTDEPFAGFSFYGSPFGYQMDGRATAFLELTEEQQTAAEEIFELAHEDIEALREAAHDEIRALLTEEQLAILDEAEASAGEGRRGPGRLADELELTEEQQGAIDEIRTELRDAIQARHEQARDEFLDLLTDEQLEKLNWPADDDE